MKRFYLTVVLTLTCLLGLGGGSRAQDARKVFVSVPFEFLAGAATIPPGTYTAGRISAEAPPGSILIGIFDKSALWLPIVSDAAPAGHAYFDFAQVGNKYFLSKMETPEGTDTIGTPPAMSKVAAQSTLAPAGAH
jgi:hypothetical protein